MSDESLVLDEAYERLAWAGFELPNGFVNHGPMACEALATLGCDEDVDKWARRFSEVGGTTVEPVAAAELDWEDALGDYRRLPEWIGYLESTIADRGTAAVVEEWVPRLMPGLAVALFHGAIRAAHAVRALDAAETTPRQAELARALGFWAARYRPGQTAEPGDGEAEDTALAVAEAAAAGARRYLTQPNILNLHGVTGAMAVQIFVPHISPSAGAAALAQVHAEHAALYRNTDPVTEIDVSGVDGDELARMAEASGDPHEVKLVEACRRGVGATGDPAFAAAAEVVTGAA